MTASASATPRCRSRWTRLSPARSSPGIWSDRPRPRTGARSALALSPPMRKLRKYRLGAWLGVLAVAFYAWLPGHFAGHVAHTALDALAALDGDQVNADSRHHA